MGLWNWFKKNNRIANTMLAQSLEDEKPQTRQPIPDVKEEKESWNFNRQTERDAYVSNCRKRCEETGRVDREMKLEYQQVASYLTDIQRLDAIAGDDKNILDDLARKVVTLTRERSKYKNRESLLNESQYRMMEQYADEMEAQIKHLEEAEGYHMVIQNDIRQLNMEKAVLLDEQKNLRKRQKVLKNLSIVTISLVIALLILLACVYLTFHVAVELPFILIMVMGAGIGIYIMWEANRNRREMDLDTRKMNRAVSLENRVKIKYVNQEALLEYLYGKYHVATAADLQIMYQAYQKEKEEEQEFARNTKNLNHYQEQLLDLLRKYQVSDCEIWLYQATAILDAREMVEVRHRLNVRRGRLRERLDANQKLRLDTLREMKGFVKQYPQYEKQYQQLWERFLSVPENEEKSL